MAHERVLRVLPWKYVVYDVLTVADRGSQCPRGLQNFGSSFSLEFRKRHSRDWIDLSKWHYKIVFTICHAARVAIHILEKGVFLRSEHCMWQYSACSKDRWQPLRNPSTGSTPVRWPSEALGTDFLSRSASSSQYRRAMGSKELCPGVFHHEGYGGPRQHQMAVKHRGRVSRVVGNPTCLEGIATIKY